MPPKFKVTKEEIIQAALAITRKQGIDAVSAREIASFLGISSRPIFSWFDGMAQVKEAVCEEGKKIFSEYVQRGLEQPIPFLGVGQQYIRFAKEEGELYKLLFLTLPKDSLGGAIRAMQCAQELVRPSLMNIYRMDAQMADNYFRDMWLVAFSFGTLIVTNGCFFTDIQMSQIMSEFSLAICKAYKEIPGFSEGIYDKDAAFKAVINGSDREQDR